MKAIQKLKKFKNNARRITNLVFRGLSGAYERGGRSASPVTTGASDSVSEKHLNGDSSCVTRFVLRHGLFLSLYSLIKKASSKLPWRSRTNNNSGFSSSSSNYSLSGTRNYIKNFRRIRILGSASLFSLGLLLLATFVPLYNVTRTEDTEAAAGTAKDSSITFTATRSTASVDLTVTSENGTFASSTSSDQAAFSLSTTNYTGYTLTIASNNNTSALTNTNGGSLSSISSSIDESTFNTSAYNNQWGYKPNYYNSSVNSNYRPSPTTTATTLDATTTANSTAKNYTIALGARADYTNASGTYSSSNYKLMYVANPVAYSITYTDNSGDSTVANIPAVQSSDSVTTTTINLTTSTPTRTGYSFKSWCLGTVSNSGTSCSGTEYASGASFGIDRTANKASNTATLTAVWTANKYTCTKQYRLQNADGSWGNYTTDTTEQVAYNSTCSYSKTVTNYKGSENGTNGSAATNSATMNSTSGITVQVSLYRNTFSCYIQYRYQNADGGYGSYTAGTNSTLRYGQTCSWSRNADATYKAASYSTTISAAVSQSVNVDRNTFTCSKRYRLQNANGNYPSSYTSVTGETIRYGATCSYSQSYTDYQTQSTSTTITAAATLSLDLPRNTYALTINRNTTYISSVSGAGTYRWGQSVSISATAATNSEFTGWSVSSGSTGSFGNASSASTTYTMPKGASTIYANGKTSKIYMQDLTESSITSILPSTGSTYTVYDKRDDKSYTIAKLADGNYWMTQNLNIAGGTTLTSTLSNVSSNYTLPTSSTSNISQNYNTAYVYNDSTYGGYYSWTTATAGKTGPNNSNYDICPKNWRLPRLGEYDTLITKYSTASAITSSPANFLYASGNYNEGAKVNAGTRAIYWTSIGGTDQGAGALRVWGSDAPSTHSNFQNRIAGSVRCILKTSSNNPYMQDLTLANCPTGGTIAYDKRDDKSYTVKKINGYCWMTQNLRFTGTSVPSATSNVAADKTLTYYSLNSSDNGGFGAYSGHCDSSSGYSNACIYDSGSTNGGVWYNYYAATASTVSGSSNSTAASQDICPKNWHLPTGPSTTSNTDFNKLVGNTTSDWQYPTTGLTAFSAVAGGLYFNGSLGITGYGYWWSATSRDAWKRHYLNYDGNNGLFSSEAAYDRDVGFFVRCVRTS